MKIIRAAKVYPLKDMYIGVLFKDGTFKKYNLKNLFKVWPIFKELKKESLFKKVHLEASGAGIVWNNQIDMAAGEVYYYGVAWKDAPLIDALVMQVINQLREERLAQNMTQAQLAKKSGIRQANIARLENGQTVPTLETLLRITRVLGLTLKLKK